MHKASFATLILLLISACQNNGRATDDADVSAEPRIVNPEIVKRINAQRENNERSGFPSLYDIPTELPEKYNKRQISAFQNKLLSYQTTLTAGVASDLQQAGENSKILARLFENGQTSSFSFEDIAKRLQQRMLEDQKRVQALRTQPMPKLGGQPPKDSRE